jgi:hypothetical protein
VKGLTGHFNEWFIVSKDLPFSRTVRDLYRRKADLLKIQRAEAKDVRVSPNQRSTQEE